MRPIGISEIMHRITRRIIVDCIRQDLTSLGGNMQLCVGQKCGIEHAIHSLRHSIDGPENKAILLFDATNIFNVLNRQKALENVKTLRPSLHVALENSYSHPSYLYIGKTTILSHESTTQGDPLAMAMYGIAILPLISRLHSDSLTQKWYADDGSVVDKLKISGNYSTRALHPPWKGFDERVGRGAAWPSHTEHRRQRNIPRGKRTFSLPLRMGGLNIALPQDLQKNLEKLIELSNPLGSFNNDSFEIQQSELEQTKISLRQKADMQRELISKKSRIEKNLPEMKYTIQLASKKEASNWFNALPLSKHDFDLTKTEFRDRIVFRCTWEVENTPDICPGGQKFSLPHNLHCTKGGHTYLRRIEIRDVFANLMDDVCQAVQIEPNFSRSMEIFSRVILHY